MEKDNSIRSRKNGKNKQKPSTCEEKPQKQEEINGIIQETYDIGLNKEGNIQNDGYPNKFFRVNIEIDLMSVCLFLGGLVTRMYRLDDPRNIV